MRNSGASIREPVAVTQLWRVKQPCRKKGPRGIRRPRGGRLWEGARHALLRPALGAHALPVPRRRVPLGSHRPHGDGRPEPRGSTDLEGWLLSLRISGPHVGSAQPETPGRRPCENRHGHGPTGSAHAPAGDNSRSIPTGLANPHRLPFGWGRRWHPETAGNCGLNKQASHTPAMPTLFALCGRGPRSLGSVAARRARVGASVLHRLVTQ